MMTRNYTILWSAMVNNHHLLFLLVSGFTLDRFPCITTDSFLKSTVSLYLTYMEMMEWVIVAREG
jgi:hypothetical protein